MSDDLKIEFNAEQRLVICRPRGVLTEKHAAQLLTFLIPLERSDPEPFNRLLDLTLVDDIELSSTIVPLYAMARQDSTKHRPPFRTAIIASEHPAATAALLYASLMKGSKIEVRVFDNASLAAAWLGVPENALRFESVHTA
jgi:hypothetical protein